MSPFLLLLTIASLDIDMEKSVSKFEVDNIRVQEVL